MPPSLSRPSTRSGRDSNPLSRVKPQATELLIGPLNDIERRHAPRELFLVGDQHLLRTTPKVSIVGSRKASDEALRRAVKLARILVAHGAVVVSGLAEGVDTAAHRAAIAGNGRTIAVVGTPLDQVYPRRNAALQAEIARNHLVVSQFAPGTPVRRHNFPIRNRTMALIVEASVIVEAGDTSGSLSQGWEALRLGRMLFIMASILKRRDLKWPDKMVEYGAQVLVKPEALLDALPFGDVPALSL